MQQGNKWGMFRNFLHNELGITKDDIREWIKESVQEEASRMVSQGFNTKDIIHGMLFTRNGYWESDLSKEIKDVIKKEVEKNFKIQVTYENSSSIEPKKNTIHLKN